MIPLTEGQTTYLMDRLAEVASNVRPEARAALNDAIRDGRFRWVGIFADDHDPATLHLRAEAQGARWNPVLDVPWTDVPGFVTEDVMRVWRTGQAQAEMGISPDSWS